MAENQAGRVFERGRTNRGGIETPSNLPNFLKIRALYDILL